tara:strand:+ start:4592 stop:5410 length:819 start_codon:yes stop_codon:yes gene_type:complete
MTLKDTQVERYSRHIILSDVGGEGQEKLLGGRVLIIGAGGLGSPIALYLAAAGVGHLGIVDADRVDLSNLQRQIAHYTADVGRLKTESAQQKINAMNPDVSVTVYHERFEASNAFELMQDYDFVIDGTDSFESKFLINDACVIANKPFSHGGILRFDGQTFTYKPGHTCYRCIFDDLPPKNAVPTCSQAGVLGSIAGMLGTIQATEAIKYLLGVGTLLTDRILSFDAKTMQFRTISVHQRQTCKVCSDTPSITKLVDYEAPVCDLQSRGSAS